MLRLLTTVIGQPVVSQRDGLAIGKVKAPIFDGAKGKLVAYRIHGVAPFLATVDILAYLDEAIVVSDDSVLQNEDDLARIKRLGTDRTALLGSKVVTDHGRKLGRLTDVLLDTATSHLVRIHVRPGLRRRLFTDSVIIPRERILTVTPHQVTVRYDGTRAAGAKSAEPKVPEAAQ